MICSMVSPSVPQILHLSMIDCKLYIIFILYYYIILFFCSTLSEFENFLLCERILINLTTCQNDLEPLRGSSNKKTLYSTHSSVNWPFFGTRGPLKRSFHSRFKLAHSCQKKANLHMNSLNKLLLFYFGQ
jgi:hypothetical protein